MKAPQGRMRNSGTMYRMASLLAFGMALFALPGELRSQSTPVPSQPTRSTSILRPEANRLPDANEIMQMREEKVTKAKFEAANIERKRQIDSDSVLLLKLTTEVKADLDKNAANAFSPDLLKKLEQIQNLAHAVQVKMKLTMNAAQ